MNSSSVPDPADPADPAAPARVGEQLRTLGPYFAAESHDPDAGPPRAPWRPMGELLDDASVLAERVEAVRGYLAAAGGVPTESIELRVAASVAQLGLAARTLSPLFALAVLGQELPAPSPLSLRDLRWQPQPVVSSMFAFSIPGLDHVRPSQDSHHQNIELLADELCEITRPFGVSAHILWGNVASALNGARVALSAANPQLAHRAQAELTRLLSRTPLAGTSRTTPGGRFQRRNCCLIYRAAPDRRGPVCGDCILAGRRA